MKKNQRIVFLVIGLAGILALSLFQACGKGGNRYDTNLLKNPSFEDFEGKIPKGWTLKVFKGLEGEKEAEYGLDENVAYSGDRSFYFKGDLETARWFVLSQEIEAGDADHVRLKGHIRLEDVARTKEQYAQCNFFLSFYDKDHQRFDEMRFADKRTRLRLGTMDWLEEDWTFRIPKNTKYVEVACAFGMHGTVWFDDVSLEIPKPIPWETSQSRNFDFHWLPGHPYPPGAMEEQQAVFDSYCKKLGITSDERISYFLYPDTTTIRDMLGLKGDIYISWNDREIHSVKPVNGYEIIHLITDPFGMPPKALCEGTAFYLQGGFLGKPIHPTAIALLAKKELPSLGSLIDYNKFASLPVSVSMPAITSFVAFLVETWGTDKLIELYRAAKGTNAYTTFGTSFERVYGMPASEAEFEWRQYLIRKAVSMSDSTQASPIPGEGK